MLISDIERNRSPEPEKQLERIVSAEGALKVSEIQGRLAPVSPQRRRRAIVLRSGDRRCGERRRSSRGPAFQVSARENRRRKENRQPHPQWSAKTHQILILAVELDPGSTGSFKKGEEVFLEPVSAPKPGFPPPSVTIPQKKKAAPSAAPDVDRDYVLHLHKPPEYRR